MLSKTSVLRYSLQRALIGRSIAPASALVRCSSSAQAISEPLVSFTPSFEAFLSDLSRAAAWNHGQEGKPYDASLWDPSFCREVVQQYDTFLQRFVAGDPPQKELLSAETVTLAFKTLLKSHYQPGELSNRVRDWERALGKLKQTPLTDHLSLRLLTANGKAGNIGRVLSLLQLRKTRKYPPRQREFVYAITALRAAQPDRNIFMSEGELPAIDNPTRWLDAILINMHERNFPLTVSIANRMLLCYAAGYSGKAVHHFYRIVRQPVATLPPDERPDPEHMPQDWFYLEDQGYKMQPIKVRLRYNRCAPPFYKKPSQVSNKVLHFRGHPASKFQLECDPAFSVPLAAAFAFADSLEHGACGHAPIQLNTGSYNALIKASVERGALWRAMNLIDNVMTDDFNKPNHISYNLLLAGLARVGDIVTTQEYFTKMMANALQPDPFTVRAVVDGLLNCGDAPGAVTVVQDFFNQHSILPPYTTHIKIIEFCLGTDLIHEAKRHVYFLQQLWHWKPNDYHSESFVKLMLATQRNTQLQRPALQKLFEYFGEELEDSDFL